jgi:hypothetical protein
MKYDQYRPAVRYTANGPVAYRPVQFKPRMSTFARLLHWLGLL